MEKEQFLEVYRHSLAHILAKAVIEIYGKEVQYAIGPQIADGCYYDFVLPEAITESDFKTIENKMREIIKRRETWTVEEVDKAKALDIFKDQKFKTELIQDLPEDEKITVYYTGEDFVDLCRGPHIDNSQLLMNVAFQVKSVSGAYWRGDEHRDQMQRVYLYAFPDKNQLKDHLKMIKEAMERDHKKLGPQLELFMFNETAQGMPYWLPRGWKLYQALMQYSRDIQDLHEYQEISAPLINNKKLWLISGHWAHYVNNMFIIPGKDEDEKLSIETVDTMAAKPMNCPNAMMEFTRPEDFMGDIKLWDDAEAVLKKILDKKYGEGNYEINEGDGAFYGPKIDLQIKDALGREWQCGTIQLDFQLPRNFELKYIAQDGSEKTPVVIHRAIFGSLERFIGIIIENFKGAFPFWMSPYQVAIVPIRPEHNDYAKKVAQRLKGLRIRVEADYSDNNMKQKIKKFKNYKDPYILVLGDKEAENETVSINMRGSNKQINDVPLNKFIDMCMKMNMEHSIELLDSAD